MQHLSLPASAYYEQCLARTGWSARFECLRGAPFATQLESCIAGTDHASQHC